MSAHKSNIPKEELETISRCFLPDIIAFFETEEGKREFEKWKHKREKNNHSGNKNVL